MARHWLELASDAHSARRRTFVSNQIRDMAFPSEHDAQHLLSEIVGRHVGHELGGAEAHVAEASLGEGEEVHLLGAVGLVWAPQHFLSQVRPEMVRGRRGRCGLDRDALTRVAQVGRRAGGDDGAGAARAPSRATGSGAGFIITILWSAVTSGPAPKTAELCEPRLETGLSGPTRSRRSSSS